MAEMRIFGNDTFQNAMRTCDELLRISLAQRQAIAQGKLALLEDLLEQRWCLLAKLDLEAVRRETGESCLETATKQRSSLTEKLNEVLCIDEENSKSLKTQLADLKSQLTTIAHGRQALQGYAYVGLQSSPSYLDSWR